MTAAIDAWHAYVKSRDAAGLDALLAEDAVFESPVVHTPQVGRPIVAKYLASALKVLGNDSFTYVNEWTAPGSAVLEFQVEIDGIKVNGVDIIGWNAAGQIDRFKVMIRPLKAINLLHQKMAAQLTAG